MTDRQIEIGEKILHILQFQNGEGDSQKILINLKVEGYSEFDIRDTFEILIDKYDLIKRNKSTHVSR